METEDLFKSLLSNAIDYLNKAVDEIEEAPKYSVIDFYSGFEILLKARLILEHWSLVYADPRHAHSQKFLQGSFRSVSMNNAIERLRKVTGSRISKETEDSFRKLQDHRNKLIHFFHPEYSKDAPPELITGIVADMCDSWLHMFTLIMDQWQNEFEQYNDQIQILNNRMLKLREYLRLRFDSIQPELEKMRRDGAEIVNCPSCGFDAARHNVYLDLVHETKCHLCRHISNALHTECNNCSSPVVILDLAEGSCDNCGEEINLEKLIDQLEDDGGPTDDYGYTIQGYCINCEWVEEPSIIHISDKFLCLICFEIYDFLDNCEWCNEMNGGDMSNSYASGCVVCFGRIGWKD